MARPRHLFNAVEEALDEVAMAVDPAVKAKVALRLSAAGCWIQDTPRRDEAADVRLCVGLVRNHGRTGRDGVE